MAALQSTKTPIQMIYDKLAELFNNGANDIFQMEFPARLLEQGNYAYPGSDTINAQQIKPPAVAEAEFRLSNDMYDVSNVVGGANGNKLSEQYREIIFSMISSNSQNLSQSEVNLRDDQAKICAWLEEEVPNFDPPSEDLLAGIPTDLGLRISKPPKKFADDGTPDQIKALRDTTKNKTIARVDLYQKLVDVYNGEKFRWVQFKDDARPRDFSKQAEVDAYDRLLSTYAPVVDAKLEALWTVLVVRGQYHKVRRYIGYVDIETASETLQRAKESLRASVCRSIDDTEDIYPVVFTPANWAKHLSTNFKPEDLLNDTSIVRNQLYDAEKNRQMLLNRMNALKAGQQDINKLKVAEESARRDLSQSQLDMTVGYADTVIKVVQLYFEVASKKAQNAAEAVKAIDGEVGTKELNQNLVADGMSPLTQEQFTKLRDMQASCLTKQDTLQKASESFTRAQLALAQAKSQDGTNMIQQLQDQIDSLTMDIEYYKQVLSASTNPLPKPITVKNADGTTAAAEPATGTNQPPVPTEATLPAQSDGGASVWQEVVLTYNHSASASTSLSTASVSHESWNTGIWFWSASGSSDSSFGSSSSTHSTNDTDIKIAFRCMKVEINRPWFEGGLLAKTKDFFRSTDQKIASMKPADVKASLATRSGTGSEKELLPSFATSFVVVKDVHIVLKSTSTFDSSYVSDVQKSSNAGGGFLCFSVAKSSSSSDHRESAVVQADGMHMSIKIAAPQVIGWISELTPQDESARMYNALPNDEFVNKTKIPPVNAAAFGVTGLLTPPPDKGDAQFVSSSRVH